MAVTKALITTLASEFSVTTEARILAIAEILADQVPVSVWGSRTDLALAYLVMHTLKLDAQGGNGNLTQEKIGDISVSYAAGASGGANPLSSTTYGQRFLELRKKTVLSARVT